MYNKKRYFTYLIAAMLLMPACSSSSKEKEEVVTTNNTITVTEPASESEQIVPTIAMTQDITSYFYEDVSQPVIYQGILTFNGDFVEKNVTLRVNYIDHLKNGNLYELKLYSTEEIPEDRLTIGYFYVQTDKIYKINAAEDTLNLFRESGELPSDSVVVCQEEGYQDTLSEEETGYHQYLEVDGDKRVYHSYNNQVSSGFYETFTWELGKGLINYRSGYGAEADAIELQILSSTIDPTHSTAIEPTEDQEWVTNQSELILQQKPEYKDYLQNSYQLGDAYVIVYEGPDADKEDWMNYSVDIWAYSEDWITQVVDKNWLVPDSFQVGKIVDQEYFRYDLSYATESTSTLLMLDDNTHLRVISLPGAIFEVNGYDITVISSSYDMIYSKIDQYSTGHTWKPYYYYLKDYEIIEYNAVEIGEEEFSQYLGANEILDRLKEEYSSPDKVVNFSFIKRDNDLIHVNINVETTDDITFYYETVQIQDDQSLVSVSRGEGTYGGIIVFTE
jgi:hypothetical protein